MATLIKKIVIKKTLELVTGLHIGDSKDNVEIGGVDKPVIRRTIDNLPYIPGSSIKGKMRCLLEQIHGSSDIGGCSEVNNLFGFASASIPACLIVRDSNLSENSSEQLKISEYTDMPYTEIKYENSINRIEGTATNPRQIERVPAGAIFDVEFVINVWKDENENTNEESAKELLNNGIKALENDYLGGSGSRGYGQIKFTNISEDTVSFENYFAKS